MVVIIRIDARGDAAAGSSEDGLHVLSHARGCAAYLSLLAMCAKAEAPRGNPGFSKARAMTSETLHEERSTLDTDTIDRHRAIVSLMEELEAIDWYDQRIDAATDKGLRAILTHNRDEEKEHAAMVLEWLRRKDAKLDAFLRRYLFTVANVTEVEDEPESDEPLPDEAAHGDGSLGIGSLREED